jgi:hypothetical protein
MRHGSARRRRDVRSRASMCLLHRSDSTKLSREPCHAEARTSRLVFRHEHCVPFLYCPSFSPGRFKIVCHADNKCMAGAAIPQAGAQWSARWAPRFVRRWPRAGRALLDASIELLATRLSTDVSRNNDDHAKMAEALAWRVTQQASGPGASSSQRQIFWCAPASSGMAGHSRLRFRLKSVIRSGPRGPELA